MAPLPAPAEKPSHRVSDSQSHAKVRPPTQVAVFCAALWPNLQPALTVGYAEAKNLGVNLVALGNDRVLSMRGAKDLNARMRALGFDVFDPDMSMFTLGGGGVHCLCQALCREEV